MPILSHSHGAEVKISAIFKDDSVRIAQNSENKPLFRVFYKIIRARLVFFDFF